MSKAAIHRVLLVLLVLLSVACNSGPRATAAPGSSAPTPATSPTTAPTQAPSPSPSPIGNANVAIVKVEQLGGMLPPWMTLGYYPSVALYGDGRLIMQGPQIDIYPGPALPNLLVTHLTQAGLEQVLTWAAEAGLQGPDRQLGPMILDSGSTVFTIVSPAGSHHTSVTDLSASDPEIGAVRQFHEVMLNLRAWLADEIVGTDAPYAFDRMRLIVSPADAGPDGALATQKDWPLDEPLSSIGQSMGEPADYRCALLEGSDLQAMLPLFAESNELTQWSSEEVLYSLDLRPLYPDEAVCPGV